MMTCGVYEIVNTVNGKRYVGSSNNIESRWSGHRHRLRNQVGANKKLQNSWNKYGEQSFKFSVIEECPKEELIMREQIHINLGADLNVRMIAESNVGRVVSDQEKIIRSHSARLTHVNNPNLAVEIGKRFSELWKSEDYRKRMSRAISKAQTRAWSDPEKKKKRMEKSFTEDSRLKSSESSKGSNNGMYISDTFAFISPEGDNHQLTMYDLYTKYNLDKSHVSKMCRGKLFSVKGWTIKKAPEGA